MPMRMESVLHRKAASGSRGGAKGGRRLLREHCVDDQAGPPLPAAAGDGPRQDLIRQWNGAGGRNGADFTIRFKSGPPKARFVRPRRSCRTPASSSTSASEMFSKAGTWALGRTQASPGKRGAGGQRMVNPAESKTWSAPPDSAA